MPVEKASTIAELDASWPLPTDEVSKGDDHLRNFKSTMKQQFPGANGDGFNVRINASEADLNFCVGITSNIQEQLNALGVTLEEQDEILGAPIGTLMLFHSSSVPPGWVTVHYGTDYMLRVIDPAIHPATEGGTDSPIDYAGEHYHTIHSTPTAVAQSGADWALADDIDTSVDGAPWHPRYLAAVVGRRE